MLNRTNTQLTSSTISLVLVVQVAIMVFVVAITLILDLAIAVLAGCLCACLVFAWDAGTRLTVRRRHFSHDGDSVEYSVRGPLYFGSVKPLMEAFFPLDDEDAPKPKRATVDLRETEIYDVRMLMNTFITMDSQQTTAPGNSYTCFLFAFNQQWSGIMAIKTVHDRFESNGTSVTFMNLSYVPS
jgi:MFS superfamily sulfate permease-like transporter